MPNPHDGWHLHHLPGAFDLFLQIRDGRLKATGKSETGRVSKRENGALVGLNKGSATVNLLQFENERKIERRMDRQTDRQIDR